LADADTDCAASGLMIANAALTEAALSQIEDNGYCGDATGTECAEAFTVCEIPQLDGEAETLCTTDPKSPATFDTAGFCYVTDAESPIVADCPIGEQRSLRAVGAGVPVTGGPDFLACGR